MLLHPCYKQNRQSSASPNWVAPQFALIFLRPSKSFFPWPPISTYTPQLPMLQSTWPGSTCHLPVELQKLPSMEDFLLRPDGSLCCCCPPPALAIASTTGGNNLITTFVHSVLSNGSSDHGSFMLNVSKCPQKVRGVLLDMWSKDLPPMCLYQMFPAYPHLGRVGLCGILPTCLN